VNSHEEVDYRVKLSKGFLKEAEEDFSLKRWRACVDNSQLCVENAGKAILTLFGVSPKTHEPAKHLSGIVNDETIPEEIRFLIKDILPEFLTLGLEEHFMTDYGDESTYTLPWDLGSQKKIMYPTERTELLKHISVQWYNKKGESPYLMKRQLQTL